MKLTVATSVGAVCTTEIRCGECLFSRSIITHAVYCFHPAIRYGPDLDLTQRNLKRVDPASQEPPDWCPLRAGSITFSGSST